MFKELTFCNKPAVVPQSVFLMWNIGGNVGYQNSRFVGFFPIAPRAHSLVPADSLLNSFCHIVFLCCLAILIIHNSLSLLFLPRLKTHLFHESFPHRKLSSSLSTNFTDY